MVALASWDIGFNMYIVIIYVLVSDVINFEINHSSLIKPFSYRIKKVWTKTYISSEHEGFQLPEIVLDFRLCL